MNKKIFIILPHKDQFIKNYAGSASIWVKDFFKKSKFKNTISIFGSTDKTENVFIKKNYLNIKIPKLKFSSKSDFYTDKLIKYCNSEKPSVVEIHNRPSYLINISKKYKNTNFILVIHNDPLNLKGSISIAERKNLLNICYKIYFVSSWVEEKFFNGIDKNFYTNFQTIYPSIHKIVKFPKKENIIIFSGKLNAAKGFDKFASAIIKILNKYKNWKSIIIGDEPREKYSFKHPRLIFTGWISQDKVLSLYDKSSITVVPSLWEEPFGRSSLESGSRGNAVIVSKRGGLPETIDNPVFLEKISSNSIYFEIEKLIQNKKVLKKIQTESFKRPLHLINKNIKIIDDHRQKAIFKSKKFYVNKNSKLKILHVFNRAEKIGGRIYFISTGKKIENGLIRLGHDVEGISDRDILSYNSKINAKQTLNRIFLEKSLYYRPDIILLGHVNTLDEECFQKIKSVSKNTIFSQWYEDNLTINGPDFEKNYSNLKTNFKYLDNLFISTHPDDVSKKVSSIRYHFLPTPVDKNIEKLNVYNQNNYTHDVFFAMSHGVNRGTIKAGKKDERETFVKQLIKLNKDIKFDIYGFNERNPVWSESFYSAISRSSMAVNINRGKPKKYSSSNRIGSLIGNGLLTFIDFKKKFNHFFNNKEIIFYNNKYDLSEKLKYYKINEKERRKIARNGQKKYFELFNEIEVAKYIVNESLGVKKYSPKWHDYLN
tara:strand:+ start:74 stop:2206 length:2133 start_codon:yes stop_codon:yes gene_type:complete